MIRLTIFLFTALIGLSCSFKKEKTENIKSMEMKLSAFGVEADNFPNIDANINFTNNANRCTKSYYNPANRSSIYQLSMIEMKRILELLQTIDLRKFKKEYAVSSSDQPTSTTTIYTKSEKFIIKDYGLKGAYPLQELYKIIYKF